MKPVERIAQLHSLSKVYAKAKADCEYLKHFRKSKLAMLKAKYLKEDFRRSNAACGDLARSDNEYLELLQGLKVAIEESESALWELKISQSGIEIWRTEQSNKRAEIAINPGIT